LSDCARAVEPDELRLADPVKEFIDQGLAFVVAVRKQDTVLAATVESASGSRRSE
jgi:hypothetical protein